MIIRKESDGMMQKQQMDETKEEMEDMSKAKRFDEEQKHETNNDE